MKKVEILNTITGQAFGAQVEDPTEWIASCIANNSWGIAARECPKTEEYEETLWIEDFEKEIVAEHEVPEYETDENGDLIYEDYYYPNPAGGRDILGQRPIPTGETTTVPATFETWVRLKATYEITITNITEAYEFGKKIERKIATGGAIQDASERLIHLITGDNMESGRTAEQIAQMQVDFATINALISAGRLITAKPLIEAIDNEEYTELKADILGLYALSGF